MRAATQHYSLPPILTYYRGSGKPIKHSKSPSFLVVLLRCVGGGVRPARLPRRDAWYFLFTFFLSCLISSTQLGRLAEGGKKKKITHKHGICLSNHILAMQTQHHCWTSLNKLCRNVTTSWDCLLSVDASRCHGYSGRIPFWRKQTGTVQTGVL